MTKVEMLVSISGAQGAFNVGDEYPCTSDEAKRFIAAGMAKALRAEKTEKAVKTQAKTEKAVKR